MKVIEITENGYVWHVPLQFIAEHRANYYAMKEDDNDRALQIEYIMTDDSEGIDWLENNMDWSDVKAVAKLVLKAEVPDQPDMGAADFEIIDAPEGLVSVA